MSTRAHIVGHLLFVLAVLHVAHTAAHVPAALPAHVAHGIRDMSSHAHRPIARAVTTVKGTPIIPTPVVTTKAATLVTSKTAGVTSKTLPKDTSTTPLPVASTPTSKQTSTTPTPLPSSTPTPTDSSTTPTQTQAMGTETQTTSQENQTISMGSQTTPAAVQATPAPWGVDPSVGQSSDPSSSSSSTWSLAQSAQSGPSSAQSLSRVTIVSSDASGALVTLVQTATVTSVASSTYIESASAPSASVSVGDSRNRPISQELVIGLSIAAGVISLGIVAFFVWRRIRKRTNHSLLGHNKGMNESIQSKSWDAGSQAALPLGPVIGEDGDAKALIAARRAVLDAMGRVTQEAHALFLPGTARTSALLPTAIEPSDAAAAAPILASAGAVDQDPYYNLLEWEMRRVRSEYVSGAPPTYVSAPDVGTTLVGREAPPPVPMVLEPLRFTMRNEARESR